MNYSLITLEALTALVGLGVLLADLWMPASARRVLGYGAAAAIGCILVFAMGTLAPASGSAFGGMFVVDGMARFFKAFFLLAGMVVLIMSVDFAPSIGSGLSEFFALVIFALVGMLFAASANDLVLLFVSLELITVTFYVLNSFQRSRVASLEAGIKYLILGAVASGFMVFGIALIFGTANSTSFQIIAAKQAELAGQPLFLVGLLLVLVGLGFKIAAFPFQIWAPDVYQGSPAPAAAFLSVGSKAAGFVLLLRLLHGAVPQVAARWQELLMVIAGVTILYGSLCAIPQRNLKRLLGYSSIANAGYLLIGVAATSSAGFSAVLYYLGGYFFTVLAAFAVISVSSQHVDGDDVSSFAGLGQRSPLLAACLTMSMASLAGIPPLAGFFGKVLLLRSAVDAAAVNKGYIVLLAVAAFGVVASLYYYFGVIRAMYWSPNPKNLSPISPGVGACVALAICVLGMLMLGVAPNGLLQMADAAAVAVSQQGGAPTVHAGH
jgi:NADH-quinone oxidoreductase subunit N